MKKFSMLAAAALAVVSTTAHASTNYDIDTGTGFVAKGDVQLAFGWNNRDLQNRAGDVTFAVDKTIVTEVEWTCTRDSGENTQERQRTTTTSKTGVFTSTTRDRNQVTGFLLTGFSSSSTLSTVTEGPALNSCPTFWSVTSPAGDPVLVSSDGSLTATHNSRTVNID
jgi:hypothetical protein